MTLLLQSFKTTDLCCWKDLTKTEQAEFDLTEEQKKEESFFFYRDACYRIADFVPAPGRWEKDWDGAYALNAFSAVLMRVVENEQVEACLAHW